MLPANDAPSSCAATREATLMVSRSRHTVTRQSPEDFIDCGGATCVLTILLTRAAPPLLGSERFASFRAMVATATSEVPHQGWADVASATAFQDLNLDWQKLDGLYRRAPSR